MQKKIFTYLHIYVITLFLDTRLIEQQTMFTHYCSRRIVTPGTDIAGHRGGYRGAQVQIYSCAQVRI